MVCLALVVKLIGNAVKRLLAVDRQITALGQLLPDQPVDFLSAAPVSRAKKHGGRFGGNWGDDYHTTRFVSIATALSAITTFSERTETT